MRGRESASGQRRRKIAGVFRGAKRCPGSRHMRRRVLEAEGLATLCRRSVAKGLTRPVAVEAAGTGLGRLFPAMERRARRAHALRRPAMRSRASVDQRASSPPTLCAGQLAGAARSTVRSTGRNAFGRVSLYAAIDSGDGRRLAMSMTPMRRPSMAMTPRRNSLAVSAAMSGVGWTWSSLAVKISETPSTSRPAT